jgi:dynein intermediate chain 4, axonemal
LKYQCEKLKGRTVSCLDFNSINTDLLVATYGEHDLAMDNREGYLAFWTLKNPDYPERLIKTQSRAMSCSFSKKDPNLVGVGCYDGVVAIYDIRQSGDRPVADSKELDSKHLDVVWQVNWVGKSSSNDKGEGLVSISSDGKIMEWSIKKGLEAQELKLLNRVTNPFMKEDS